MILYVCDSCWENFPEGCGKVDRADLRVMPDGTTLCDQCYDNEREADTPQWKDLPPPVEHSPKEPRAGKGE